MENQPYPDTGSQPPIIDVSGAGESYGTRCQETVALTNLSVVSETKDSTSPGNKEKVAPPVASRFLKKADVVVLSGVAKEPSKQIITGLRLA